MLEISYKYLNQLDCADYRKYKGLKSEKFDGGPATAWLCVLLHVLLASLVGILSSLFSQQWHQAFFIYLFVPYAWGLAYGLGDWLADRLKIKNFFGEYEKRSRRYENFQKLRRRFLSTEMEIEEQLDRYNKTGLDELIDAIRKNLTNKELFDNLVEIFQSNHAFVEKAAETLGVFTYRHQYKRSLHNKKLLNYRNELVFEESSSVQIRIPEIIKERWTDRLRQRIKTPKSRSKFSYTTLGAIKPETKPKQQRSSQTASSSKPAVTNTNPPQTDKAESIWNVTSVDEIPKKKVRKSSTVRTIKASDKFWEALGSKRIEIGKKGEMLVMEYERRRITREYGKLFLSYLKYSALIEGDGLGYDIASYFDDQEIFIEVKTTTGDFWNGLIFTKNELESMRRLGDRYFLYRIFHFDKSSNTGKLKIFNGCEEIEKEFDFSPQTFLLEPKN